MGWSRRRFLAAGLASCVAGRAHARSGFRVIVHPSVGTRTIAAADLSRMFLKQSTRWPDGTAIRPVDLTVGSEVRRDFTEEIIGRTVAAVRSYWQQAIFSGRGVPPPELDSDAAVVAYVTSTAGAIGYVSAGAETNGARTIEVG
jgi:ABC-type phosphate transport system substrate-binding protein